MNCEDAIDSATAKAGDSATELDSRKALEHIAACDDCSDAMRAREALHELRQRDPVQVPEGLSGRITQQVLEQAGPDNRHYGFWHGTGLGAALAASLIVAVLTFSATDAPKVNSLPAVPAFEIVLNEARNVNVAIDAGRAFPEATVTVYLSGDVELAGFGTQRELSWTTSLKQGVNQLTLPIIATGLQGGTLLVRLDHEGTQKEFRVELKISG